MKAVSSSIVVLAGAVLIAGGAAVTHSDTQLFVTIVGILVGMVGLGTWIHSWIHESGRGS
jgi:hypothetical protein